MAELSAESIPEHCPGTQSENAGKAAACKGCPNQGICSSGKTKQNDPDIPIITEKLSGIKHKILVLSGKGGVGKSTVTATLARGIALDENKNVKGYTNLSGYIMLIRQFPMSPIGDSSLKINIPSTKVGVLDIDICGPSMPVILGVDGEQVHQSGSGWSPIYVEDNLSLMSVGFLLGSPEDAVIWRGPKKNGLIKQFLRDVDWGDLDYLLVDTPPGTSDEHLSIVQYMKDSKIDGAVIVTTPQEVSLLDVRKEIDFCRKLSVPIIGVIENMSGFVCPNCKVTSMIFPPTTGGGEKMAEEMKVPFLGKIPLDPRIGKSCDEGKNFIEENKDSPAGAAYKQILDKIIGTEEMI